MESILGLLENIQPKHADELDQLESSNDLDAWDEQIAKDSESGKLDDFVEGVLASHKTGKTTKLSQALKRSE